MQNKQIFKEKIFREYDIRGVYGQDYTDEFAVILAKSLVSFIQKKEKPISPRNKFKISIGRDARHSGIVLSQKLIQTFLAHDFEVVDLGVVPTPLVYFSSIHLDIDAPICVTGSHNPAEYNGFKIGVGKSTLHGSDIQELKALAKKHLETHQQNLLSSTASDAKNLTHQNIIPAYIKDISSKLKLKRKLKVVVDSGNGTGAVVGPQLLEAMGCEVIPLYCELDGNFPNHHPDPTVLENLRDLQKLVLKTKADVGIAYDGDADRIGAVDEQGNAIYGDELLILFSREILSRKPGATIISEVKSSHRLYNDIKAHGGNPIMWKTGHSLIKSKMKQEKAELAGEMSGHMFFSDRYYGYDDAIYASARLLEIIANSTKPFSSHFLDIPKTINTPEIRVDCEDEIKFQVVEEVKQKLSKQFKTIDIDGVRIETEKGWGLLRASNTQPVVVMRFEAETKKDLDFLQKTVEDCFEQAKRNQSQK